jgi:hypothetical protein
VAIYHYSQKPLSRKSGRSAPAAAAYRAGARLDGPDGRTHDYRRRAGVLSSTIVAPEGATWARDRQQLWSAAEASEARKDARTAREHEIALPSELTESDAVALAQSYAREIRDAYGCAVDVSVHRGHTDQRNIHAHLLATTREAGPDGLGEKCRLELSDKKRAGLGMGKASAELDQWRQRWEQLCNEHLAAAEIDARVDHRSLADQGADRSPQPKMGAAHAMERRGITTERGTAALEVERANQDPDHRFEVALQRQREHIAKLERAAARVPSGMRDHSDREVRKHARRRVAGQSWVVHCQGYGEASKEAQQKESEYQSALGSWQRYTGPMGFLRRMKEPIQAARAGKELERAAAASDQADADFEPYKEARSSWAHWFRKEPQTRRVARQYDRIHEGLQARHELPAAREQLQRLKSAHEQQQSPSHVHERQRQRERDGPQLGM